MTINKSIACLIVPGGCVNYIDELLQRNKTWRQEIIDEHPDTFKSSAKIHKPKVFWLGCSDSRVPVDSLIQSQLGEVFVHRNVANLAQMGDLNFLTTLDYALNGLGVEYIVVCGHYGCAGVAAALSKQPSSLVDHWVSPVRQLCHQHREELSDLTTFQEQHQRLVELSLRHQVEQIASCSLVQRYWQEGRTLSLHGLVYSLEEGLLKDLDCQISSAKDLDSAFRFNT